MECFTADFWKQHFVTFRNVIATDNLILASSSSTFKKNNIKDFPAFPSRAISANKASTCLKNQVSFSVREIRKNYRMPLLVMIL